MKKILLSMTIVFIGMQLFAQQDENIHKQRIDELSKNISQLESSLNDNNRKIETLRKSQFNLEENLMRKVSESEVASDSKLAQFELQIYNYVKENRSVTTALQKEMETQKKLVERMHTRQKINFLIIYILLFSSLFGVVFVYVYYGKMFKDFDIFQLKRNEELKTDIQLKVDANQKYLVSKVDTSCDEVRSLIQKCNESFETHKNDINDVLLNVSAESDKKIDKFEKSLQATTNENLQKLIVENSKIESQINTLSEKILGLEKETKHQIEALKKSEETRSIAKAKPRSTKKT